MDSDYGSDFITITDEEGNEFELEVVDIIDYNNKTYALLLPADIDEMEEDDPNYGYIILTQVEEPNGEIYFQSIDDDDELNDIYERFMALLFADEDEDEEGEEG